MEIEVGEYIRTKNGKIDKVINNNCYMPQYIECEKSLLYKEDIVNHSKDFDLIEVRRFCKWLSSKKNIKL